MLGNIKNPNFQLQVLPLKPSIFIEPKASEVPMSLISGIISLRVEKPIQVDSLTVSLKKSKYIEWNKGPKVFKIAYDDIYANLKSSKSNVDTNNMLKDVLQKGYYEFPFFLWISDDIEPSLSFKNCYIKYHLEATVNQKPNNSYSLKSMMKYFQTKNDTTSIMIHQVPKILKQYSWEMIEQLPHYISLYQKDNIKIVLMLQTRYLPSTGNNSTTKATLYIDYKPGKDDQIVEVSCKDITLTLTEEYRFFEKSSGSSNLEKVDLGKIKHDLRNSKVTNTAKQDLFEHTPSESSLDPPSYYSILSTPTMENSFSSTENSVISKTPQVDTDPRISYEFYLPQFDREPQPNYKSENFSIDLYLRAKATIEFKSFKKKKGLFTMYQPENNLITKEKEFSAKSIVYGIPKHTEDYIHSLPAYQEINKCHLYYCHPEGINSLLENETNILLDV
ncbi:hypothetical protein BB559_007587 [Furculomyces boomerangus]|uniref:Arrestin-like N-terminal domain-containing protein n=2 Tax=Harpellales TaxID=61421 RepID=A0A2T9XWS6_9FUNG|nr:hypothetical protein BB559_007587 [Furculomyces boomerangus]PVZ99426.1 hypothetical protein BB558_004552 [Smittium angustum]